MIENLLRKKFQIFYVLKNKMRMIMLKFAKNKILFRIIGKVVFVAYTDSEFKRRIRSL